jgi:cathepsin L
MFTIFLGFVLLLTTAVLSSQENRRLTDVEYMGHFDEFRSLYGKTYTGGELTHRFKIFKANLDFVNSWDAEARGFKVAMNEFGDLTSDEFNQIYNGMNITASPLNYHPVSTGAATVDWRTKGAVTGIKNQGQCGSCWSFSATGSMEGARFLKTGKLVSLSEQNLVDCSTAEGNQGCNGGLMDSAFKYVIKNKGIDTEASYPYTATGPNSCKYKAADNSGTLTGYTDVPSGDENSLRAAVDKAPVSVAIDASHSSFQLYHSGVYYEPACSPTQLDHGVLAIGYGTDGISEYWLVKNSWGTGWGNQGYIEMAKNRNNNCGIASAASYPAWA